MKELPILFSGPMVRAILEGRKTQTRRIIKNAPTNKESYILGCHKSVWGIHENVENDGGVHRFSCPYGVVGNRLWVRETFCQKFEDGYPVYNSENDLDSSCCWYKADGTDVRCDDGDGGTKFNKDGSMASPWTPSIHMPRWASRLTLEITGVRVERLNDITPNDVVSEGIELSKPDLTIHYGLDAEAKSCFADIWDSINGDGSWNANPWVWVVEFKQI